MADQDQSGAPLSDAELQDLVASTDTGARNPGGNVAKLLAGVALAWSIFQLWIASPLPFMVTDIIPVLNNTETRSIHLAFAIFLAFMAYPALKRSPRNRVPLQDWVFAIVGAGAAGYLFLFYGALSDRPGAPIQLDLWVAGIGMVALLEATRRALGPPLMIVAMVFLGYVFFGDSTVIPDAIRWKGASFAKAMGHQWLTTEGVYGIALGVSTSFVFLFVLFGSLLDKAGAGNYFIKVAFSLLGHLRACAGQGMGVVLVLHDLALAMNHADRVVVLDHGTLAADGPPDLALAEPVLQQVWGVQARWLGEPGGRALAV